MVLHVHEHILFFRHTQQGPANKRNLGEIETKLELFSTPIVKCGLAFGFVLVGQVDNGKRIGSAG